MNFSNCKVMTDRELYWCANLPNWWWPCWIGGHEDFIKQNQPFGKLLEMRLATMLEF